MQSEKVINALTIDVEDYFQVSAFAPHIPRSDWPARECRVERNVDRILLMLDQHGVKATFFALGWLAENLWAFDCLERAGYRYSSSIYPIRHDHYGMPEAPRHAHVIGGLLEIPATTLRFLNRNWPASGGGYFRLMPYGLSRWMLRRVNHSDRLPAVFYFHPWEIDSEQPRIPGISAKTRFRHYVNIHHMEARLHRLLGDFRWGRMDELFLANV